MVTDLGGGDDIMSAVKDKLGNVEGALDSLGIDIGQNLNQGDFVAVRGGNTYDIIYRPAFESGGFCGGRMRIRIRELEEIFF
jgi:hypothetical protein